MAAAAAFNLPEDATHSLQDQVHDLQTRMKTMIPLLATLLDDKLSRETEQMMSYKNIHYMRLFQLKLFKILTSEKVTDELARAKYEEVKTRLAPMGYELPSIQHIAPDSIRLSMLANLLCMTFKEDPFAANWSKIVEKDPAALEGVGHILQEKYDQTELDFKKQIAAVKFLQEQRTRLLADPTYQEEMERKEMKRRALEAQIAALEEELHML
jgi:hypothetical protein